MPRSVSKDDAWVAGGILAVLGLYVLITAKTWDDVTAAFFLLGLGIVEMAATSKQLREQVFNFFFSVFKGLWGFLSRRKK